MRQIDEITIQEAEEDLINHILYSSQSPKKQHNLMIDLFKKSWSVFSYIMNILWKFFNYLCWIIILFLIIGAFIT
tara:strand:+ start:1273 stop:1497 length:225 start_codon:yes stop_codon:yes gene_type:complete